MSNIALIDVKHVDGEPWEVAQVAGQQVQDALELSLEALEGLFWAARGSWLSQQEYRESRMPEAGEFEASPLGRQLQVVQEAVAEAKGKIKAATLAASYDPRSF